MRHMFRSLLLVALLSLPSLADYYYVDLEAYTGSQYVPEGIWWGMLRMHALVREHTDPSNDSYAAKIGYLGRMPDYIASTSHYLPSNPSGRWTVNVPSGSTVIRDYNTGLYWRVSWGSAYRYDMYDTENILVLPVYFAITLLPL